MEESQSLEKLPKVVTGILKIVLCSALIALALVLIIALDKITYSLAMMVLNTSSVVPYDVAEQAVMFFLYFGFIGLIVQYFKSGYHFPLRYFIYAGITAMLRLIIVNHESSVDTILFAGAILIMVIALCLVLYSNKLRNL
jgi:protein psiE homolog